MTAPREIPFKPLPGSSTDAVVRDILHGLSDGRYVPGQRLVEPDLMQVYGVGRSTVREALGRLSAGGVVEQMPHRGARIRRLDRRAAHDLLRVTEALLGLAAREAAEAVARGADAAAFAASAEELARAGPESEARARARYYRDLVALGGNGELRRLLPALQIHLIRAQLRPLRQADLAEEARADVAAAILAGDPAQAEARARAHVARLTATLPAMPETAFSAPDGR